MTQKPLSPLFCLLCAALPASLPAAAAAEPVQSSSQGPQDFDLPSQTLGEALKAFSRQTRLQLFYDAELVAGKISPALQGRFTPSTALQKILENSGIRYRLENGNTLVLEKAPTKPDQPQSANTLPSVTVVGQTVQFDATDPYNEDYVLPNATSGTKTDTPIMETPLNVQVISKQVLKDQQVINLGQALKNVSGVTTGSFAYGTGNANVANQQITLRGFASETFFRNGFRLQQGSAQREMANVESVEVLKGPAAILYGLAEPGGMVNVVTKQPLATPYYSASQQFGSYDLYRTVLDATGPLTQDDTLLYRTVFSYENSNSFRDLVFNDSVFFAPSLKWNISPKTQAMLELEYQHKKFGADVAAVPVINGQLLNIPNSRNYGEYSPGQTDTIFVGLNWSHQFNDDWSIKHRVSANLNDSFIPVSSYPVFNLADPATLAVFQSFVLGPITPNSIPRLSYINQKNNNDTYSTNLDLVGHFDTLGLNHTLLFGGDYYRLDSSGSHQTDLGSFLNWYAGGPEPSNIDAFNPSHPGRNYPPTVDPTSYNKTVTNTDQYGLYFQDQIKLPYNFQVMGGIRYQYIHQKQSSQNYTGTVTPQDPTTQDAVTPRVGILWQPQSWLSLYANYVEGFGANTGKTYVSPGVSKTIDPTSASQYEGGIKTSFFDGRLRATLAYYDLTKTNLASTDPDVTHVCGGERCKIAIGEVHNRGPELDIQGEILPGWNAIATYSYTDTTISKTNPENEAFLGLYPVGTRYWGVPRNTASVFSTYEFQSDTLKGFKFGGGINLQSSQLTCCNAPQFSIPGYATVDLLAAYSIKVGKTKVSAQLNVNNLLDTYYFTGAGFDSPSVMFPTFGQPRFFMGSISVQY
ncbi:TonB-dependent siderophore receptor [Methylomonas sp. CM2]|uniref:TonB-dependent siderophore receptor n=1 Tax=Methylomonas sp. CM2 TaxID=3417647 RepID=UPI003CF5E10D